MLYSKVNVGDNREYVKNKLQNKEVQKYIVNLLNEGGKAYSKAKELEKNVSIDSYVICKGIERVRKIGNAICNCDGDSQLGITTDAILTSKIPIIKIGNIFMTIKSLKCSEDILKNKSEYIKKFSKVNYKLDPQISMFDEISEEDDKYKVNEEYYCVLTYHFSQANTISYVEFIFLDEKANSILFKIKVPKDIILSSEYKITHKDNTTRTKENIKGNSLKELLKIK